MLRLALLFLLSMTTPALAQYGGGAFGQGASSGGGSGSGTVNSGTTNYFAYYPSSTTTVGSQSILYTDGTNIGVSQATPVYKLDVNGPINGTNFTGTWIGTAVGVAYGGTSFSSSPDDTVMVGAGGTLAQQLTLPTCTAAGKALTYDTVSNGFACNTILSGLTTNMIQKATSATAIGDSIIFDNATNVGIGSTNPGKKLDIAGSVRATAFFGDGTNITGISGTISGLTTNKLTKASNSTTIADSNIFDNATNVGIGSTNPGAPLDVNGTIRGTSFSVNGSGTAKFASANGIQFDPANATFTTGILNLNSTNVGINSSNPQALLTVGSTGQFQVNSSGAATAVGVTNSGGYTQSGTTANTFTGTPTFSNATFSALFTGGNVGINSTSPSQQLDARANSATPNVLNVENASANGAAYVRAANNGDDGFSFGANGSTGAASTGVGRNNGAFIYITAEMPFDMVHGSNSLITSDSNTGNVGIGTGATGAAVVVRTSPSHANTTACWGTGGCAGYVTGGTLTSPSCTCL